jgi:quercetin dioxygenase-like cupin family protein
MKATHPAPYVRPSETIMHAGKTVCIIVRAEPVPKDTTFYTPHDFDLQVGKIVYPAGSAIARHRHPQVTRTVARTLEVLIVQEGRIIVDLYTDNRDLLCSRELGPGDVVLLTSGGHGFRLLEHTVLLEVKQGPYRGSLDKELF